MAENEQEQGQEQKQEHEHEHEHEHERFLHAWVDVNGYMRDDYRLLVATMAARQIKSAPPELAALARKAFEAISVPGARSFFRADLVGQRKALAKTMQGQPQISALVIALWAGAAESQINLLKQAGETAGLEFAADWDWGKGMEGFYDFNDIVLLSTLSDKLGEHMSEQDADHLKLAALWLGPAVTNVKALGEPKEEEETADGGPPTAQEDSK